MGNTASTTIPPDPTVDQEPADWVASPVKTIPPNPQKGLLTTSLVAGSPLEIADQYSASSSESWIKRKISSSNLHNEIHQTSSLLQEVKLDQLRTGSNGLPPSSSAVKSNGDNISPSTATSSPSKKESGSPTKNEAVYIQPKGEPSYVISSDQEKLKQSVSFIWS
jgi:hypothetical protein